MVLAPADLLVVVGPGGRVGQGRERGKEEVPLSCLFPRRDGCSPRIDEPELRIAGARPALAARWAAVGKLLPSPTSMRILAPVLTPIPGIEVRTLERGWASSSSSIRPASSVRWSRTAVSEPARLGTINAAASVPGTTTVCSSSAVKMSSTSRSAIRGAFGRNSVISLRRPALRIWAGKPNRSNSVSTAGCWTRGPRTRSRWGWICVTSPRNRLLIRVASSARSSSNPTIISSSAMVSSSSSTVRSVCGMTGAASAMTNASRASVLASPG